MAYSGGRVYDLEEVEEESGSDYDSKDASIDLENESLNKSMDDDERDEVEEIENDENIDELDGSFIVVNDASDHSPPL